MPLERLLEGFGEHRPPVLVPFASSDRDLVARKVDVLHAQAQTLHQAQAGAVQKRGHQPLLTAELPQYRLDLVASHDHGYAQGPSGADCLAEIAHFTADHVAVQEQQCRQGLVLRRGTDPSLTARCVRKALISGSAISAG